MPYLKCADEICAMERGQDGKAEGRIAAQLLSGARTHCIRCCDKEPACSNNLCAVCIDIATGGEAPACKEVLQGGKCVKQCTSSHMHAPQIAALPTCCCILRI